MITKQLDFLKNIDENFTTLFVEDNFEVRKQTIKILQNILPRIIPVQNGEEGIRLYKEYYDSDEQPDIDLIISDIQMPKKGGLTMIAEIKELNPSIPIIIISAYSHTEYFLEAITIGIDNYILKPFTINSIINILYKTLKKHSTAEISNEYSSINNNKIDIGCSYFYDLFNKVLYYKQEPIKLSRNEHVLLEVLIKANGQSVPYKTIEYHIWDEIPDCEHSLRSLIYRFRLKTHNDLIQTVSSFGYKLPYIVVTETN